MSAENKLFMRRRIQQGNRNRRSESLRQTHGLLKSISGKPAREQIDLIEQAIRRTPDRRARRTLIAGGEELEGIGKETREGVRPFEAKPINSKSQAQEIWRQAKRHESIGKLIKLANIYIMQCSSEEARRFFEQEQRFLDGVPDLFQQSSIHLKQRRFEEGEKLLENLRKIRELLTTGQKDY